MGIRQRRSSLEPYQGPEIERFSGWETLPNYFSAKSLTIKIRQKRIRQSLEFDFSIIKQKNQKLQVKFWPKICISIFIPSFIPCHYSMQTEHSILPFVRTGNFISPWATAMLWIKFLKWKKNKKKLKFHDFYWKHSKIPWSVDTLMRRQFYKQNYIYKYVNIKVSNELSVGRYNL